MRDMSITEERIRKSVRVSKPNDNDLLKRIAQDRDEAAFTCFFERYKGIAVNLALHVTGDPTSAEDAVQEVMLRIWHGAESFKGGNVRGWFTRIVVRESIQIWRGGKRLERKKKRVQDFGISHATHEDPEQVHQGLERKEALSFLKRALLALPEKQRIMLALHFGAGLSQREVGSEFGVSQRAISKAIDKSLSDLRKDLKVPGVGSMLPVFSITENLAEALCSQHEPSDKLLDKVLDRISSSKVKAIGSEGSQPGLPEAQKVAPVSWLVGGVALLALAASGAWVVEGLQDSGSRKVDLKVVPTESLESAPQPLHEIWTFKEGPMKGFSVIQGKWISWRPASKGRPAAMVAGKELVGRILPAQLSGRPVKITIEAEVERSTRFSGIGCAFVHENKEGPTDELWRYNLIPLGGAIFQSEIYVLGNFIVRTINNKPHSIRKYEKPFPTSRVCLLAHGVAISRIEIRDCPLKEIPESLQDPNRLLAEIMQSPSWSQLKRASELSEVAGFRRPNDSTTISHATESPGPLKGAKHSGLHRVWNFQKGPHKDLKALQGKWESWRPADGTKPAAMLTGKNLVSVVLPVALPEQPFRIRVTVDPTVGSVGFRYVGENSFVPVPHKAMFRTVWAKRVSRNAVFDAYCMGPYIIKCLNGVPVSVQKFDSSYSLAAISFRAQQTAIERVEISEISRADIPKPFRDPGAFVSAVRRNASWTEGDYTQPNRRNANNSESTP